MIKTRHIWGLAVAGLLLFTAGCPVDVNEGDGGGDDGPSTSECPKAELATVRFFHGAGGTPVTRPDFGPSTTRNLNIVRPDVVDDDGVPLQVTSMVAGRATIVQICGNKPIMLGARLAGSSTDRVTLAAPITFTPDADPSKLQVGTTIILAGIADTLVNGQPENPASTANPLRFIVVPDAFAAGTGTQIQVVHVSRKTPEPVDVEADPDRAGAEITTLMRYTASTPTATKGTPDTAPSAVTVAFLEGTTTRASFSISPRIPAGAKALAIHFDTEIFDPKNPDPAQRSPAPVARLFVTGNDPLLGLVAGGGVTF